MIHLITHRLCTDIHQHAAQPSVVNAAIENCRVPPILVVGMHRSGTTLLTQVLEQMGVFMGAQQGVGTNEAIVFRNLNCAVFKLAHTAWDWPTPMHLLLNQPHLCGVIAKRLATYCQSSAIGSYFGISGGRSPLQNQTKLWGWKDPRTVFTLPLWLRVFPQARVIHVYRNGIDVSHSLVARERARGRGSRDVSLRCLSYEGSFELWAEYLTMIEQAIAPLPKAHVLEMGYETLLTQPTEQIDRLCHFLQLAISPQVRAQIQQGFQTRRAHAFLSDAKLVDLYRYRQQHPLMRRFDYADLMPVNA